MRGQGAPGTPPDDPAAFVAAAEKVTNERDAAGAAAVYAPDADLEMTTDGAVERYHGRDEIHRAWLAVLAALDRRRLLVSKELVNAGNGVIVNTWGGSLAGRTEARGVEMWRFDAAGLVREHRLYTFLSVRPSRHWLARLKFALAYPRTSVILLREQRRAGVRLR
jgi:nuclear transport factor 2 (NTF2) superfamily protein